MKFAGGYPGSKPLNEPKKKEIKEGKVKKVVVESDEKIEEKPKKSKKTSD